MGEQKGTYSHFIETLASGFYDGQNVAFQEAISKARETGHLTEDEWHKLIMAETKRSLYVYYRKRVESGDFNGDEEKLFSLLKAGVANLHITEEHKLQLIDIWTTREEEREK